MKTSNLILISFITLNFLGCSSDSSSIKDWLKEGTKEYQETSKESTKVGKTNLKDYLAKNGCVAGTSAKIIETKNNDSLLYEVICVKKSEKFVVKCDDNGCAK